MISGIWSGYQGLPGRLKKHNPVTSGSFDALINYITGNQVYKFSAPKFIKDTLYAEELEYELIIDSINGIYGYNFITEKKDYHIGIRKLIIENIIPEKYRWMVAFNPMAPLIRSYRRILLEGRQPDWQGLALTASFGLVCFMFGYWWFERTKKAFADVL